MCSLVNSVTGSRRLCIEARLRGTTSKGPRTGSAAESHGIRGTQSEFKEARPGKGAPVLVGNRRRRDLGSRAQARAHALARSDPRVGLGLRHRPPVPAGSLRHLAHEVRLARGSVPQHVRLVHLPGVEEHGIRSVLIPKHVRASGIGTGRSDASARGRAADQ